MLVREALPRTRFRMASVVQTGRGRRSKFSCAQRGLVSAARASASAARSFAASLASSV